MEEKNTETPETVETEEDKDEVITISKKEYENQKNSTSEAQFLLAHNRFLKDNSYFETVYKSDKKIAERIARENGFSDAEELYEAVQKHYGKETPSKEVDVSAEVQKQLNKEKAEGEYNKFFSEKNLDIKSKFGEDVIAEFNEIMGKRNWTPELVKKYLPIAFKTAKDVSKFSSEYEKTLEELAGSGVAGGGTKGGDKTPISDEPKTLKDKWVSKK